MRLSPVWDLIHPVGQQRNSNSCWMAIKQQLQHYCTDGQKKLPTLAQYLHVNKKIYLHFWPLVIMIFFDCIDPNRQWEFVQSMFLGEKSTNHILMLWYSTDVVSWRDVERLFHQSVFESMPLTRVDQKGVLLNAPGPTGTLGAAQQPTPTIIPWDNPQSYAKQQLNILQAKGLLLCWLIQSLWCLTCIQYFTR